MKKRKPKMNFYKTQQHRNAPACIEVVAISDRPENLQGWVCRSDWSTFEAAHEVAEAASIFEGVEYIAIDRGAYTSPRFDVIRAPQVLDPVSYSFNGDSYPCGYIKTISKSLKKITTTTGETFYRRKQTGAWLMNRQWSMIAGHIEERNPHF
jgi:hypothetical protein